MTTYIPLDAFAYERESERLLIAGCLAGDTHLVDSVLARIQDTDLGSPLEASALAAMREVRAAQDPVTALSVARVLRRRQPAAFAETLAALNELAALGIDELETRYNLRVIEEAAILRSLREVGRSIELLAQSHDRDAAHLLSESQAMLLKVADRMGGGSGKLITIGESMVQVYQGLQSETAPGIPTGWRDLNQLTGGLHPEDLTLVAARPGNGKTAWGLNLAADLAATGVHVFIASVEMGHRQLSERVLARRSGIDGHRIRNRSIGPDGMVHMRSAVQSMLDWPVTYYDQPTLRIDELRAQVRAWTRALGSDTPKVLIVDYIQLVKGSTKRREESRVLEVGEVSSAMKQQIARDLKIPVIALSQLSRAVEGRTSHIPMLSDLRESGNLEQDADNVLFLYREEMYDPNTDKKGVMEFHLSKHRNGPVGVVPVRFDPNTQDIRDLTYREVA